MISSGVERNQRGRRRKRSMNWSRGISALFLGALVCFVFLPSAKAGMEDEATIVTFNEPVEVSGTVLPAGTYMFKRLELPGETHIVQIFNRDETHIYATIRAISDIRPDPTSRPVFTFERRAKNLPEAIKSWFYPGRASGFEFQYPRVPAVALAKAATSPVASMPTEMAASPMAPAEPARAARVAEPTAEEAESPVAGASPTETPAASDTQMAKDTGKQLPKTASSLPLLGLIALGALGAGASLRLLSLRFV
jgi:hypothetical protein